MEPSTTRDQVLSGIRVLVVEIPDGGDEPLSPILAEYGATVRSVLTDDEAVAALDSESHDLLLARIRHDDDDPFALIRQVRALDDEDGGGVPAVAVGVQGEPERRSEAIESGFDDCVVEPFDREHLVEILERTARQIEQAAEVRARLQTNASAQARLRRRVRERQRTLVEERSGMSEQRHEMMQRWRSLNSSDPGAEPDNGILKGLPPEDFERIARHLDVVALPPGFVVEEAGASGEHVYFLRSGLASRIVTMADGATIEAAVVGRASVVGVGACFGAEPSPVRTVMQLRGVGARMSVDACREEFDRGGGLQQAILRHSAMLEVFTSLMAACNRLHTAEQRLARWLLLARDMTGTSDLPVTQEQLSGVLGTRRVGVTLAAGALKKDGVIDYSWGQLHVSQPAGLETRACECYARLKALLPD